MLATTPFEVLPRKDGRRLLAQAQTLRRLSRGRAVLRTEASGLAAVVELAGAIEGCRVFGQAGDEDEWARVAKIADGLVVAGTTPEVDRVRLERVAALARDGGRPAPVELWVQLELPADRAGWRHAISTYRAIGVTGLVVPQDPRLLDLLRRSDEDDDRSDLSLSQG